MRVLQFDGMLYEELRAHQQLMAMIIAEDDTIAAGTTAQHTHMLWSGVSHHDRSWCCGDHDGHGVCRGDAQSLTCACCSDRDRCRRASGDDQQQQQQQPQQQQQQQRHCQQEQLCACRHHCQQSHGHHQQSQQQQHCQQQQHSHCASSPLSRQQHQQQQQQ